MRFLYDWHGLRRPAIDVKYFFRQKACNGCLHIKNVVRTLAAEPNYEAGNDTNIDPNDGKIYCQNYGKADINSTSAQDFPQIGRTDKAQPTCNTL